MLLPSQSKVCSVTVRACPIVSNWFLISGHHPDTYVHMLICTYVCSCLHPVRINQVNTHTVNPCILSPPPLTTYIHTYAYMYSSTVCYTIFPIYLPLQFTNAERTLDPPMEGAASFNTAPQKRTVEEPLEDVLNEEPVYPDHKCEPFYAWWKVYHFTGLVQL